MTIGLEHWIPAILLLTLVWQPATEFEDALTPGEETDVDLALLSSLLIV